jgi:hypothetical protein
MRRPLVQALVRAVERRAADLGLAVGLDRDAVHVADLTAYLATLATQYLHRGRFA